jgi:hypothetical protein
MCYTVLVTMIHGKSTSLNPTKFKSLVNFLFSLDVYFMKVKGGFLE